MLSLNHNSQAATVATDPMTSPCKINCGWGHWNLYQENLNKIFFVLAPSSADIAKSTEVNDSTEQVNFGYKLELSMEHIFS